METPTRLELQPYQKEIHELRETGRLFFQRGWSVGTSSNYSVVTANNPLEILVTASGKHKGDLGPDDFVLVDANAEPTVPNQPKSSAETWLHVVAAKEAGAGAILHTHSVWGTLLSHHHFASNGFWIEGYEMLKGLDGVETHEHRQWIPIFDNTQDIPALARQVQPQFTAPDHPPFHAFLIRNHGLYTWAENLSSARRQIEVLEFLFEVVGRQTDFTQPILGSAGVG